MITIIGRKEVIETAKVVFERLGILFDLPKEELLPEELLKNFPLAKTVREVLSQADEEQSLQIKTLLLERFYHA